MSANELLAELHPGRTLRDDVLQPLNMSVNALAKDLHVPATRLNDVVRGPARDNRRYRAAVGPLSWHQRSVLA